jgi:hypothetical protein
MPRPPCFCVAGPGAGLGLSRRDQLAADSAACCLQGPISICILNGGSIRTSISAGNIT